MNHANSFWVWRLLYGCFLAILMYFVTYHRQERESREPDRPNKPRYIPFINSLLLMTFLFFLPLEALLFGRSVREALHLTLSACFAVLVQICLFYPILLALLPVLRKKISARSCAALWLLPNFLYLIMTNHAMMADRPLLVLYLPERIFRAAVVIWLTGFLAVFFRKVAEHICFRKTVLAQAQEVSCPDTLALWEAEQQAAGFGKHRFRLVTSPAVTTPLTIGFLRRSIRVILPKRTYTQEELALILRHEVIHLGRSDAADKLFMTFCNALCWFHPLMWLATQRSAEDAELSCDEAVLQDADPDTRLRYAELLLTTAGDDRGFSSNLSNSAKALRYRLQQVVHPGEKTAGAIVMALASAFLLLTCGLVSVTYGDTTGQAALFSDYSESMRLDSASKTGSYSYWGESTVSYLSRTHYTDWEEAPLQQWLSDLELSRITGQYSFDGSTEDTFYLYYEIPDGHLFLELQPDLIAVKRLENGKLETCAYRPKEPLNYEELEGFFRESQNQS